jgi:hypothetical protein
MRAECRGVEDFFFFETSRGVEEGVQSLLLGRCTIWALAVWAFFLIRE